MTGIEAGLVLPTGQFRQTFKSGPEQGEEVDRGLQPGTGTVQAVLGAYHLGPVTPELGYFVQVTGQKALTERAGYRPGSFIQASGALNLTHWRNVTPQLQLSFRQTWRDSGPASDRPNSGGDQVNVAPGLSAKLGSDLVGFTYVELPLYTRVNGYQLVPKVKLSGVAVPPLTVGQQRRDDLVEGGRVEHVAAVFLALEDEVAGAVVDPGDGDGLRDVAARHSDVVDPGDWEGVAARHLLELFVGGAFVDRDG